MHKNSTIEPVSIGYIDEMITGCERVYTTSNTEKKVWELFV